MKFSEVIGKQEVKDRLMQSVSEGRISHAQLFSCYEGSYGLPMAMAYAQLLHCESPVESDSCGRCASCLKHEKLIHPDLHFSYPVVTSSSIRDRSPRSTDFIKHWRKAYLENPYLDLNDWYQVLGVENKQGFMSVEESADILRKLSLKSFESKFKIQIIWMPEKMRVDASNKLLKIIEEPPDLTVFLLVTDQSDHLLPTILSRTQLVKIPRLSIPEIAAAVEQKFGSEPKYARRIASLSNGNLTVAFNLASETEKEFSVENEFMTWMRLCYSPFHEKDGKNSWTDLNSWVDRIASTGRENMKLFFSFCLEAVRDCLMVHHGGHELIRFDDEVIPNFSRFSKFIHSGNVSEITDLINKAHYAIERNANPRILLLDLSFKMNRLLNKEMN